jgi:DNA modification methylase
VTASVLLGDVVDVLRSVADNTYDAVLCDPPYGLAFMGKRWDYDVPSVELWAEVLRVCKPGAPLLASFGTRTYHRGVCRIEDAGWEIRDSIAWMYGSGFPKSLDVSKAIDNAAGAEREVVGYRPNPDGYVRSASRSATVAMGEPNDARCSTLLTAPATDAARLWSGYGTALKPAHEPYVLARKPLDGTVAQNVARWGVGALAIDATRITSETGVASATACSSAGTCLWRSAARAASTPGTSRSAVECARHEAHRSASAAACAHCSSLVPGSLGDCPSCRRYGGELLRQLPDAFRAPPASRHDALARRSHLAAALERSHACRCVDHHASWDALARACVECEHPAPASQGRWPANVILDGQVAAALDEQAGERRPGERPARANGSIGYNGGTSGWDGRERVVLQGGGASRFFYCAKASRSERDAGCEGLPAKASSEAHGYGTLPDLRMGREPERRPMRNHHPTVKPLALCEYLARLIMPPQPGAILVPFAGSGSEMIGALRAGWPAVVGIEREPDFVEIAKRRLEAA